MHRLEMDYHRRPSRGACESRAAIPQALEQEIRNELASSEDRASRFSMVSELFDSEGQLCSDGHCSLACEALGRREVWSHIVMPSIVLWII